MIDHFVYCLYKKDCQCNLFICLIHKMYPVRVHISLSRVKKICSFSNLISFNFGFSITITRGNKLWKQ